MMKPALIVSNAILLSVTSNRSKPSKLLSPPIVVNVTAHTRILEELRLENTPFGRKVTTETDFTLLMYLSESESNERIKVLEFRAAFLLLIEPEEDVRELIGLSVDKLPKHVKEQLVAITTMHALPLAIRLCELHRLPLPINMPKVSLEE